MAALLLFGYRLGDCDQNLHCEQSDAILIIASQVLEEWDHVFNHNCRGHALNEFREVVCRLSPDHGRFIVDQLRVMLPQLLLVLRARVLIGCVVKASGRNL